MANKPLRSIQFPGLTDTYTVAATDTTLAIAGEPADAKATGDAIAAAAALATAADSKATVAEVLAEDGLISYGNAVDWEGNTSANMALTRHGIVVTLNGSIAKNSGVNYISFIKFNGTPTWAGTVTDARNFTGPLTDLIKGHTYRFSLKHLSGTISVQENGFGAGVMLAHNGSSSGSTVDIGESFNSGNVYTREFVYPGGNGVHVGIRNYRTTQNIVMTNVVLLATLEDLTPDIVPVSGTTPTITAETGKRYVCTGTEGDGIVSELSFTPCSSGLCEVRFTSGTTAALLTVPNTVKWPSWFDPAHLEASTTYEISIADGVYGAVMTWPT